LKLLFDTHAALWWTRADERFSAVARQRGFDPQNRVLLSAVVVWEVAIKRALGKLEAPADLVQSLLEAGAAPLPVTLEHAAAVEGLPHHHSDPFDRLLIAQAKVEGAVIVTRDPAFGAYGVPVLW
jgi:PIN domain nuclease of toxin-antitoxin system